MEICWANQIQYALQLQYCSCSYELQSLGFCTPSWEPRPPPPHQKNGLSIEYMCHTHGTLWVSTGDVTTEICSVMACCQCSMTNHVLIELWLDWSLHSGVVYFPKYYTPKGPWLGCRMHPGQLQCANGMACKEHCSWPMADIAYDYDYSTVHREKSSITIKSI